LYCLPHRFFVHCSMKKALTFYKISATGNDFILFDNRTALLESRRDAAFFSRLCRPHTAVGADGVILLEQSDRADFREVQVNSDGSWQRCAATVPARSPGSPRNWAWCRPSSFEINDHLYHLPSMALPLHGRSAPPRPMLSLPVNREPHCSAAADRYRRAHLVVFVDAWLKRIPMAWPQIPASPFFPRYQCDFVQLGTETSFGATFERGVEAETLACCTGAVAAALIAHVRKGWVLPAGFVSPEAWCRSIQRRFIRLFADRRGHAVFRGVWRAVQCIKSSPALLTGGLVCFAAAASSAATYGLQRTLFDAFEAKSLDWRYLNGSICFGNSVRALPSRTHHRRYRYRSLEKLADSASAATFHRQIIDTSQRADRAIGIDVLFMEPIRIRPGQQLYSC
jgi:diaminopimelate epimerase